MHHENRLGSPQRCTTFSDRTIPYLAVDGKAAIVLCAFSTTETTEPDRMLCSLSAETGCSHQGNDGHHLQPDDESDRPMKANLSVHLVGRKII